MSGIPPFIPFLLLGGANGLFLNFMERAVSGPGWEFSVAKLFGYPVFGVISLALVSVVSLAFPAFTEAGYLNLMRKKPAGSPSDVGKWVLGNGSSVLLGGIFNGYAFWVLGGFQWVQGLGFFGSALIGAFSLTIYTSLILPLLNFLFV